MKSLPNFDFLKSQAHEQPLFDEFSGLNNSTLQHSSTFLELSNASKYNKPLKPNKLEARGTLIHNAKSTSNLLEGALQKHRPRLFEEFFIIGVESQDVQFLDWSKSRC